MNITSRRNFLKGAALATTAISATRVLGANDRVRLGVIGTGGRGKYLMQELNKLGSVEWLAVCDVWDVHRDEAEKIAGVTVKKYLDHRQVLNLKEIDAVIVATPDHWHASIAVEALKAGKDVYVEKPMVHTPKDGQAIVRAVRENKRVLQVGTQGRALPQFVEAKQKFVDSGVMGKVGLVRTWYTSNGGYVLKAPPGMEKKPEGLDWDRWVGPMPKVPWNPEIYFSPYKWQNYCGGMIMGIAIHVLDSVHHLLKLTKPKTAQCGGAIAYYSDGRDTPDVVTFILEYPDNVTVTFEAECLTCPDIKTRAGIELRGIGGTLSVERYEPYAGYEYSPNRKFSPIPPAKVPGVGATAEYLLKNWLECLRSRQKPVANEVEGYYSTVACFMANQAYRTQSRVVWDSVWDLPA